MLTKPYSAIVVKKALTEGGNESGNESGNGSGN
jgi:hypothetical protein